MERERALHRYSEELKRRIVEEIESGYVSVRDAARETQAGTTQVQKWLEEYGRFKPKRDVVEVVMKSEKDKIAELEKALAEAHLKIRVYDELISQANKRYKTDLKKALVRHRPGALQREEELGSQLGLSGLRTLSRRVLQATYPARASHAQGGGRDRAS